MKGNVKGIVHPLAEELGDLVEDENTRHPGHGPERDTSWIWMVAIVVAIGVFAWVTR